MKDEIDIDKLKEIVGQELNYKKLCDKLGIKVKSGKSKIYQLKEIGLYCDLSIQEKPTRYIVKEVYPITSKAKSKFLISFEILIMQLFRAKNYQTLYLTNSQLLEGMKLVNQNYKVLKNPKLRDKLPEDISLLYTGASKSGEILLKWLDRALDKMEDIYTLRRKGFCLIKKIEIGNRDEPGFREYTKVFEVPLGSDIETRLIECQRKAYYSLNLMYDEKHMWVPRNMKYQYQATFDREIKKEFGMAFDGGYQVNVITPNEKGMEEILSAYESEQIVNKEAQNKIAKTKQLNYLTGFERDRLIKEIIARPAPIDYMSLIENNPQGN